VFGGRGLTKRSRSIRLAHEQDKIIKRGLSYILTNGTLTDPSLIPGDMSTYCVSLKEDTTGLGGEESPRFAACFVDAAIGEFSFVNFQDDANRTGLETLVLQLRPREVVFEKVSLVETKTVASVGVNEIGSL